MITLYDFELSGHAHRVRLMLALLNLDYQRIAVDLALSEQSGEDYTQINPFQQVPVLDDDGFIVRDSVAILCYLASRYDPAWYPQDAKSIALVQQWLAISSKEIAMAPAAARLVNVFGAVLDHAKLIEASHSLFKIIDQCLLNRTWLALEQVSIADIAAYTYIAHAPEGDVSLSNYPNIQLWLARVEALPNFIAMKKSITNE